MIVVGDFKEAYLNVKAKVLPSGVKTRLSILRDQSFLISRRRKGGGGVEVGRRILQHNPPNPSRLRSI